MLEDSGPGRHKSPESEDPGAGCSHGSCKSEGRKISEKISQNIVVFVAEVLYLWYKQNDNTMNYENKHRIESLAKAACPNNKKVSVIFRSKENKLSDRPNAFIVTVGKKGYTSVRQSNYWAVDTVNSCKDYSDQELAQILNTITKDLGALRFFGYQDVKLVNYKGEEVED